VRITFYKSVYIIAPRNLDLGNSYNTSRTVTGRRCPDGNLNNTWKWASLKQAVRTVMKDVRTVLGFHRILQSWRSASGRDCTRGSRERLEHTSSGRDCTRGSRRGSRERLENIFILCLPSGRASQPVRTVHVPQLILLIESCQQ
jgi:hypothetical protein